MLKHVALIVALASAAWAGDVLSSSGYETCQSTGDLQINSLSASFDRDSRVLSFDFSGVSTVKEDVVGVITVEAYGRQIYSGQFDPCYWQMSELCPVSAATFSAGGSETISSTYANQIPSIAYSIPDLDGVIQIQIFKANTDTVVGCVQASITNGKTVQQPAVTAVAILIAIVALAFTATRGATAAAPPGAALGLSPAFGEIMNWFQSMAISGMFSVSYPPVFRSWASNFGFSTGLISWPALQQSIDGFRSSTGGNLTDDNYSYVSNSTYADASVAKRAVSVLARVAAPPNGGPGGVAGGAAPTGTGSAPTYSSTSTSSTTSVYINGIAEYAQQLHIPAGNVFVTTLAIFAIVIAALIAFILLLKLVLELWRRIRPLPRSLDTWRERYWWRLAAAITSLVVILYGVWTMYSLYDFTAGDSWAAKLLAGLSLGLFTALVAALIIRIVLKGRQFIHLDGTHDKLYDDRATWIKYGSFYDSFKRKCWWAFIPLIIAAFVRGAIVGGANGHGLVQTAGVILVEIVLLVFLLWTRPYSHKGGNVINILLQVVRILSVAALFVFVEQFGISQLAKTIVGFVIIIVQAILTLLLAIILAAKALRACIRRRPRESRRRQDEKWNRARERDIDHESRTLMRDAEVTAPPKEVSSVTTTPVSPRSPSPEHMQRAQPPMEHWQGSYEPVERVTSPISQLSRSPSDMSHHERSYSYDPLIARTARMGRATRVRPQNARGVSDLSAVSDERS